MGSLHFLKMHGLGNDFVVLDARHESIELNHNQRCWLANRRFGIGCDQVIVMEADATADTRMRIYNPDGSEAGACGNATRCVADVLMRESGKAHVTIRAGDRLLTAASGRDGMVRVDMGAPLFDWRSIPLAEACDVTALSLDASLPKATCLSMGNPHAVMFGAMDLASHGERLEHHPIFPERANISAAEFVSRSHIRLSVWERAAGLTQACGTAACATLVAARIHGLVEPIVKISLPGGDLWVEWQGEDTASQAHVWMEGAVATSFSGVVGDNELRAAGHS